MRSRRTPQPSRRLTSQTPLASGLLFTSSSSFSRTHFLGAGIPYNGFLTFSLLIQHLRQGPANPSEASLTIALGSIPQSVPRAVSLGVTHIQVLAELLTAHLPIARPEASLHPGFPRSSPAPAGLFNPFPPPSQSLSCCFMYM